MNSITIGDVKIPTNEFAIAGTAWLGIKKAGKTYGAKGVAEQLMEQGIPLVIFDAIGTWRFLKTPGDGRGARGYEIVVAGGESPDVPLTSANAGEIVKAAMRSNVSLVVDLYDPQLSKKDWRKIVQDGFHALLYGNKQCGPRYVILEEAAEFIPQRVFDGETYAAVEKLARMGGNAGLGVALVTPRAQEINKAVLDLCDNLVLMRQRGSNAIYAIQKWMDRVAKDTANKIAESLPSLGSGECWVWAENSDVPQQTRTHTIRSFHPDRTKQSDLTAKRKPVDTASFVSKLLGDLPKIAAEKKDNDPAELRRRIRELESQVRSLQITKPVPPAEITEVSILRDEDRLMLREILERAVPSIRTSLENVQASVERDIEHVKGQLRQIVDRTQKFEPPPSRMTIAARPTVTKTKVWKSSHTTPTLSDGSTLSPVGQRILNALAELELLKVERPVREMVALMSGYTNLASTGFVKAVSQLRSLCLIDYPDSDSVSLTEGGRDLAQFPDAPRSSKEIQDRVCQLIGGKSSEILRPLIDVYPEAMLREEVASRAGYTNLASTGFVKAVSRLRTLGFIDYPDSKTMIATSVLFMS